MGKNSEANYGILRRRWRRQQLEIQAGLCFYCGTEMTVGAARGQPRMPSDITIDHYVPKALSGSNHPDNLVLACFKCNQRKGSKSPVMEEGELITDGPWEFVSGRGWKWIGDTIEEIA